MNIKITFILAFLTTLYSSAQSNLVESQNISNVQFVDANANQLKDNQASDKSKTTNENNAQPETLNFNCPTVFWTINSNGTIKQWDLNEGVITGGTDILYAQDHIALSFCANAFYCTPNSTAITTTIKKYTDATGWTTITAPISGLGNCGGYAQNQYYLTGANSMLYHYDGTTFTLVENTSIINSVFAIADLAVDSSGRVWTLFGPSYNVANSVRVYDHNGLVNEYPFTTPLTSSNAYGSCFINNILYIGFGPNNPFLPNSLTPIVINNGIASTGTPVLFSYTAAADLASCDTIGNLAIGQLTDDNVLSVFPNPTKDMVTIECRDNVIAIEVYNLTGELVKTSNNQKTVDLTELSDGVYLLKITTDKMVISKQILKK